VLHDVDLLGAQVGDQAHAEGVGTGDASLVVEELEPLLGQEAQTDLAGMLGALAALDGSAGLDGIGEDLQLSLAALLPLGFDFLWEKQVLFVLVSEIY